MSNSSILGLADHTLQHGTIIFTRYAENVPYFTVRHIFLKKLFLPSAEI